MAKRTKRIKKNQFVIPLLTNERTDIKAGIMKSLYDAVKFGRLAYVDFVNPDMNQVIPMLALVEDQTGDSFDISKVFPIAYFISSEEESLSFGIADGNGNYIVRDKNLGIFEGSNVDLGTVLEEEGKASEGADPT